MSRGLRLDAKLGKAAVLGGAVLGGGGGGRIEEGLRLARLAMEVGDPLLADIDDLNEEEMLITVSAVGAPAAEEGYAKPRHYIRAVELLREHAGLEIRGLISSENGALGTVNGWVQSALLGIPVVDAPCDGRAHPTGVMGSMGLHRVEGYVSSQAAVGGDPRRGRYLEIFARGSLEDVADLVRRAAVHAGGLVAVGRNPVPMSYVREHGAPGAVRQAIDLGQRILERGERGGEAVAEEVSRCLGGEVVAFGAVEKVTLRTEGGFDRGTVSIRTDERKRAEITFWNEYMTLEVEGVRLATFPDLISTLDGKGMPLCSADIKEGHKVYITKAPKERLILGSGLKDIEGYRQIEGIIGREMIVYLKGWDDLAETSAGDP